MGVTKVPVAPESRMAMSGGATTVGEGSEETTSSLEVLTTVAPPRQVEEGSQKHWLVLPPCMLAKVAVT